MGKRRLKLARPRLGVEAVGKSPFTSVVTGLAPISAYVEEMASYVPLHLLVHAKLDQLSGQWVELHTSEGLSGSPEVFAAVSAVVPASPIDREELEAGLGDRLKNVYYDTESPDDGSHHLLLDTSGRSVFLASLENSSKNYREWCLELLQVVRECRAWLGKDLMASVPPADSIARAVVEIGFLLSVGATVVVPDVVLADPRSPYRPAFAVWAQMLGGCGCAEARVKVEVATRDRIQLTVRCPHSAGWAAVNLDRNRETFIVPDLVKDRLTALYWGIDETNTSRTRIRGLVGIGESVAVPRNDLRFCVWESYRVGVRS